MSTDLSRWDVWHTHYLPYVEVLTLGDGDLDRGMDKTKRERVLRNLSYEEAKKQVKELGFGYSMHPAQ